MNIGTDNTLPAGHGHSISPGAKSRWQTGIVVTLLVAIMAGSATIVATALDAIREATQGAYQIERARIDRMEADLAAVKAETRTNRERLTGMERDIAFLVDAEKRRQRRDDLRTLE